MQLQPEMHRRRQPCAALVQLPIGCVSPCVVYVTSGCKIRSVSFSRPLRRWMQTPRKTCDPVRHRSTAPVSWAGRRCDGRTTAPTQPPFTSRPPPYTSHPPRPKSTTSTTGNNTISARTPATLRAFHRRLPRHHPSTTALSGPTKCRKMPRVLWDSGHMDSVQFWLAWAVPWDFSTFLDSPSTVCSTEQIT